MDVTGQYVNVSWRQDGINLRHGRSQDRRKSQKKPEAEGELYFWK
jgi:hypothetical protein